jgi:uncharacterized protein YcfL
VKKSYQGGGWINRTSATETRVAFRLQWPDGAGVEVAPHQTVHPGITAKRDAISGDDSAEVRVAVEPSPGECKL